MKCPRVLRKPRHRRVRQDLSRIEVEPARQRGRRLLMRRRLARPSGLGPLAASLALHLGGLTAGLLTVPGYSEPAQLQLQARVSWSGEVLTAELSVEPLLEALPAEPWAPPVLVEVKPTPMIEPQEVERPMPEDEPPLLATERPLLPPWERPRLFVESTPLTGLLRPRPPEPAPAEPPPGRVAGEPEAALVEAECLTGSCPPPGYPRTAVERGWEGAVEVEVLIDAQGFPRRITLRQSSGFKILDRAALDAVSDWVFVPARRGEVAVASTRLFRFCFNLAERGMELKR